MIIEHWVYGITACLIVALGLRSVVLCKSWIHRIIAINIMGSGVFMMFITIAYRGVDATPDSIPHALVLTGIVVAVSATALALSLLRRLGVEDHHDQ
jgi:multicomponent Na+:H+ antiporter subunit C